ncbi:S-adenosyl-L-methionine-dependent methyltransferase [Podospora australis]|uniref:S-adenosyl-L-methionine-dependent methyltransferase n=1 Tax=Podospora australis TaxID=1536484 RepID=A0AAN7AHU6_9PEZI|nr:S-adenosyl-L-methionine-dependent methyltransferase [Podospora australis]
MHTRSAGPLFNEVGAARYENAFIGGPHGQLASLEWILSTLSSSSITGANCLDIGSGSGRPVCSTLAAAGHRVLGVDVSEAMVAFASEHVPLATFTRADIRDFKVEENQKYDVVTSYFGLIAEISQQEILETLKKIGHEMLKPGGIFVWATVPVDVNLEEIMWMGKPVVVSNLAKDAAVEAVRDVAGLQIVNVVEEKFKPEKAVEAGICAEEDVWVEDHLYIWARKSA